MSKLTRGFAVFNENLDACVCFLDVPGVSKTRVYGRSYPNFQEGSKHVKLKVLKSPSGIYPYKEAMEERTGETWVIKRVILLEDRWVINYE